MVKKYYTTGFALRVERVKSSSGPCSTDTNFQTGRFPCDSHYSGCVFSPAPTTTLLSMDACNTIAMVQRTHLLNLSLSRSPTFPPLFLHMQHAIRILFAASIIPFLSYRKRVFSYRTPKAVLKSLWKTSPLPSVLCTLSQHAEQENNKPNQF